MVGLLAASHPIFPVGIRCLYDSLGHQIGIAKEIKKKARPSGKDFLLVSGEIQG